MAKRAQIELVGGEVGTTNVSVVRHASPAQKPPGKTFEGADSVPEVVGLLRDEAKVI